MNKEEIPYITGIKREGNKIYFMYHNVVITDPSKCKWRPKSQPRPDPQSRPASQPRPKAIWPQPTIWRLMSPVEMVAYKAIKEAVDKSVADYARKGPGFSFSDLTRMRQHRPKPNYTDPRNERRLPIHTIPIEWKKYL